MSGYPLSTETVIMDQKSGLVLSNTPSGYSYLVPPDVTLAGLQDYAAKIAGNGPDDKDLLAAQIVLKRVDPALFVPGKYIIHRDGREATQIAFPFGIFCPVIAVGEILLKLSEFGNVVEIFTLPEDLFVGLIARAPIAPYDEDYQTYSYYMSSSDKERLTFPPDTVLLPYRDMCIRAHVRAFFRLLRLAAPSADGIDLGVSARQMKRCCYDAALPIVKSVTSLTEGFFSVEVAPTRSDWSRGQGPRVAQAPTSPPGPPPPKEKKGPDGKEVKTPPTAPTGASEVAKEEPFVTQKRRGRSAGKTASPPPLGSLLDLSWLVQAQKSPVQKWQRAAFMANPVLYRKNWRKITFLNWEKWRAKNTSPLGDYESRLRSFCGSFGGSVLNPLQANMANSWKRILEVHQALNAEELALASPLPVEGKAIPTIVSWELLDSRSGVEPQREPPARGRTEEVANPPLPPPTVVVAPVVPISAPAPGNAELIALLELLRNVDFSALPKKAPP